MSNISIVVRNTPRLLLSSQGRVDTLDTELIICVFKAIFNKQTSYRLCWVGVEKCQT